MESQVHTINAENKILGRVASEAAVILRGKNSVSFKPYLSPTNKVKILNINRVKLSGNKLKGKTYQRYSGYPGGLKIIKFEDMFKRDPGGTFKKVVRGMLPNNKLRKKMLENLSVE